MGYKGLQPKSAEGIDMVEEHTLTQNVTENVKD